MYHSFLELSGKKWVDMAITFFPTTISTTTEEGFIEQVEDGLTEVQSVGESAYDSFHWLISHIG